LNDRLRKILLVEDDSLIASTESFWLKKAGYEVINVLSGEKAIQTMKENPGEIDLILMDIGLGPGLDGTQAAQEILKENDLPILFLSAHTEKEIVDKTEKITSFGYIVKDTKDTVLLASIKMAFKLNDAYSHIRQKEKELRESEQRFRKVFEDVPLGMAMVGQDYKFIRSNLVCQKLFGYNESELRELTFKDITHPDDVEKDVENIKRLALGEIPFYKIEKRYVRKDGQIINADLTVSIIKDKDERFLYYLALIEDITKRKETEEQLKKTSNELENYFKVAIDLLCIVNTNGNLIHINAEWEKLFGYTKEELSHAKLMDYVHPDDLEKTYNVLAELSSQKEIIDFINRCRCKDGSYKWIEWRCHPVGDLIYAGARDITDKKYFEEAIRESEAKYRILLEESLDPIFIIGSDGTYHYVNKAFAEGVKRDPTEIFYKKIWDVFPPKEAEQRFNEVKEVFSSGKTKVIEVKVDAGGSTRYYVTTIQPIKNDDDETSLVMCSSKDITERKQMEESLKAKEEEFENFFTNNPDALSIDLIDNDKYFQINPGFVKLFGYTSEEIIGHTPHQDDLNLYTSIEERETLSKEFNERGELSGKEIRCRKKDGTLFFGLLSTKKFKHKGKYYRLTSNRDITKQKELEKLLKNSAEEKELMLRELQHRIKNNLNVLSGLLSIASENLEEEKSQNIFADALSRIKTMATIYEHLYKSPEFDTINIKVYLHDLSETLFNTYNVDKGKIKLLTDFDDIRLDAKRTESLGLILNELISNSLKYAFRDRQDGTIDLRLKKVDGKIIFIMKDDGVGFPEHFDIQKSDSLGLKLIKLLTQQIDGTVNFINNNGVYVEIIFNE
jgi:PAS domain S-box-containing protein